MKYYVYYTYGSCNDGDHSYGVLEFATLEEAQNEINSLIQLAYGLRYISYKIIHGQLIHDHQ